MKRIGNLYSKIVTLPNIHLAELKARKGKSKKKYVIEFNKNRTENILKLYQSLKNKTFITSRYSHFVIFEPKKRELSKLPYTDRIIHHALLNILEPIFVKSFISQTYSCIKRRGIHLCSKQLKTYLKDKENTPYCLKLDIFKFYPSVDNEILKSLLRRKFKDKELLDLLDNIINSHKGLPLGSYTSQFLANFYLNHFCHWLKETKKVRYLLLYCDDLVILHKDKYYLHSLRREIQKYLDINLKLKLSNYQIFKIEDRGIDFVGYKHFHTYTLLRKSIKNRFKKNDKG